MAINTTWSSPATAGGSGGIDLATGDTLTETIWDRMASDLYRLGGTDGNAKTGKFQIGSTQSFSNAFNTQGLSVQQDGNDDEAVSLKSSDVAHGMTTNMETDTYGALFKQSATAGGLMVLGATETATGVEVRGYATTPDTTHNGAATGAIMLNAWKKSGTTVTTLATNENVLVVAQGNAAKFIVDADGDLFNDGASGTSTTFDGEDDAALLEALTTWMNPRREAGYKFRLARDLEAHKAALAAGGVVTLTPDGSLSMLSYKGMLGLLVDAIRQVTHQHRQLAARVAPLLTA